ncbi:MAG: glycosyltransferase family 2 protein [Planctomycetota bacterium]
MPDTAPPNPQAASDDAPDLAIVTPAHNEEDNLEGLLAEIHDALQPTGLSYHVIVVDDRSTDDTPRILAQLAAADPRLRPVRLVATGHGLRGLGPSAACGAGIAATRAAVIATLDADRQNDPADLPAMIDLLQRDRLDLVQGDRTANRRDNLTRRVSSKVGRAFRSWVLQDDTPDSACALRVMSARAAHALPLQYKGMHRFIAPWLKMNGFAVANYATHHRPRTAGVAKFGVWNRALPGLIDLLAVRWMAMRRRPIDTTPIGEPQAAQANAPAEPIRASA